MADPATLDSIDDALFAALQKLGPTPGSGTFELVARVAKNLTPPVALEVLATHATAVLLFPEGSEPLPGLTVETLSGGVEQTASRSYWRAFVLLREPRGHEEALKSGPAGQRGQLALVKAVTQALVGLAIEGLEGPGTVAFRGRQSASLGDAPEQVGLYAWMVRVSADHVDEQAERVEGGVPLQRISGDLNLTGEADAPPNPITQIRTDF